MGYNYASRRKFERAVERPELFRRGRARAKLWLRQDERRVDGAKDQLGRARLSEYRERIAGVSQVTSIRQPVSRGVEDYWNMCELRHRS